MSSPVQTPPAGASTPEASRPASNDSAPQSESDQNRSPSKRDLMNVIVQLTDKIDDMDTSLLAHIEYYEGTLQQLRHQLAALEGRPDTASMAGNLQPVWNSAQQALQGEAPIGPAEAPIGPAEPPPAAGEDVLAENDIPGDGAEDDDEDDNSSASISSAPPPADIPTGLVDAPGKQVSREYVEELVEHDDSDVEDTIPNKVKELTRTMSGSLIGEALGVKGKGSLEDVDPATPAAVTQKRGRPPSAEKPSPSDAPKKVSKAEG